jgi:hypothetical protein
MSLHGHITWKRQKCYDPTNRYLNFKGGGRKRLTVDMFFVSLQARWEPKGFATTGFGTSQSLSMGMEFMTTETPRT